ncbi:signal peptidase II [Microbacterium sp.]|uniref:signal peptidase II n=1 Tax=Microbacterium sp. TaxID=51671 RepID=UPI003C73865A
MADRTIRRPALLSRPAAGTLVAILAATVLAADQFSKHLALAHLPDRESVEVWGEFLQFYLTRNPGAAFSFGEEVTWVFTLVLAAAAVVIVVLAVTRVRSRAWAIVLGLLLGGILGNLTDRLLRDPGFLVGHVVDFINTPWMWLGLNPAIYNVADMFIVTMMISVALLVLRGRRLDGTREGDGGSEGADTVTVSQDAGTTVSDPRDVHDARGEV